jgi:hypothetical protein
VKRRSNARYRFGRFLLLPLPVRHLALEGEFVGGGERELARGVIDLLHAREYRRVDAVGFGVGPVERP